MSPSDTTTLLRDAILTARGGDKGEARRLLREVIRLDPASELAWLWLAGVAEAPQDALASLQRVLEINPANEQARRGLQPTRLQVGIAEAKAGHRRTARRYLLEVYRQDSRNESVLIWLAGVAETPHDALGYLRQVLAVNPANQRAREGLKSTRLQLGIAEAKAGNAEMARRFLREVAEQDPTSELAWYWLASVAENPEDACASLERVLAINPVNQQAQEAFHHYSRQIGRSPQAWCCPVCSTESDEPADACPECGAWTQLDDQDDLDDLLAHEGARADVLREAVQHRLADLDDGDEFAARRGLALAFLNLKQPAEALPHLQAAVRLRPDDARLRGLAQALARQVVEARAAEAQKPCLLVVDDSPTVRKLVTLTMEKHGYRVLVAADGSEATDVLARHRPDLILLDITMPGMDGYQLCKLIKRNPDTAHIPVIMLSGKDGFFDKIRGRMAGSTEYVTKPFKPEVLVQVTQKHCRAVRPGAAR